MERQIWKNGEKDKGNRKMSRRKKGDIIKCFSVDEAEVYCSGLIKDGYDIRTNYIPCEMSYNILILKDLREAADEKED